MFNISQLFYVAFILILVTDFDIKVLFTFIL